MGARCEMSKSRARGAREVTEGDEVGSSPRRPPLQGGAVEDVQMLKGHSLERQTADHPTLTRSAGHWWPQLMLPSEACVSPHLAFCILHLARLI